MDAYEDNNSLKWDDLSKNELYQYLSNVRTERKECQKNEEMLRNQAHVLQSLEERLNNQSSLNRKYQEELSTVHLNNSIHKKSLADLRQYRRYQLDNLHERALTMKISRQNTLNSWREDRCNKRCITTSEVGNEKRTIREMVDWQRQSIDAHNKELRDKVMNMYSEYKTRQKVNEKVKTDNAKKSIEAMIKNETEEVKRYKGLIEEHKYDNRQRQQRISELKGRYYNKNYPIYSNTMN